MQKLEILVSLLHLHNMNLSDFDMNELKVWLHSLRCISREIEKEIIGRDRSLTPCEAMTVYMSNVN